MLLLSLYFSELGCKANLDLRCIDFRCSSDKQKIKQKTKRASVLADALYSKIFSKPLAKVIDVAARRQVHQTPGA